MPYIDRPAEFWVGFYSTRPKAKFDLVRSASSYHALQQLLAVGFVQTRKQKNATDFGETFAEHAAFIENMIGIYLHHDAITATSLSLVIGDYLKKVKAVASRFSLLLRQSDYFNSFLQQHTGHSTKSFFDYYFCNWVETGACLLNKFAKQNSPILLLFNPAYSRKLTDSINLPTNELMLYDANNVQVENYIHCMNQFKTGGCKMLYQVDLHSSELKLLRLKTLDNRKGYIFQSSLVAQCTHFLPEAGLKLRVNCSDRADELLVQVGEQPEISLNISLREYLTKDSGPYVFKPAFGFRHSPRPMEDNALLLIEFVDSPVALEVRYVYSQHWTTVRFVKRSQNAGDFGLNLEVELFLRSPTVKNDNRIYTGKEVLVDFKSSFVDNADFFYSQNGLDLERADLPKFKEFVNDIVDDFGLGGCKPLSPDDKDRIVEAFNRNLTDDELVSGYFRPVSAFIGARDRRLPKYFAVLVDRPQAGVSRLPSELQLIIERKSVSSDFRGVNEVTYDDYDGLWSFKLCFHHGPNEDRLRKQQLLKEAEVLKLVTASNLADDLMRPADAGFRQAASSFDSDCLKVDMSLQAEAEEVGQQESLLVRTTNYCSQPLDLGSLADLLEAFDLPRALVREAVRMTVEGVYPWPSPASPRDRARPSSSELR